MIQVSIRIQLPVEFEFVELDQRSGIITQYNQHYVEESCSTRAQCKKATNPDRSLQATRQGSCLLRSRGLDK
jgi:hypothetical protein